MTEPRSLSAQGLAAFLRGLTGSGQFSGQIASIEDQAVAAYRAELAAKVRGLRDESVRNYQPNVFGRLGQTAEAHGNGQLVMADEILALIENAS